MLFDLQAKGRRRMVKVVYVFLAILIGGGLVFFGIGGSGTGLLDAGNNNGSSSSGNSYVKQAAAAESGAAKKAANPSAAAAGWAAATRLRFQAAGGEFNTSTGTYTDAGNEQLKLASADWQNYLRTAPGLPDPALAKLMAQTYSEGGLNQAKDAVKAWQIVVTAEPTSTAFAQLAISAYLANDEKVAEAASKKALASVAPAQKAVLTAEFKQAKLRAKQIAAAVAKQAAQQQQGGGAFSPTG